MADRYCRNCGSELRPDDRFCSNCARPVHEMAHVPTPEADVPVPPPPTAQQATAPTRGRLTPTQLLVGGMGLVIVLLLLVLSMTILGGGGGAEESRQAADQEADSPVEEPEGANEGAADSASATASPTASASASASAGAPVPDKECSVGKKCDLGTGTVTLNEAEYTNEVTAKYEGVKSGNFVVAEFDYTYNGNTTASTGEPPWLVEDEDGRTYTYDFDTTNYYTDIEESILNVEVQPGVGVPGRVIFSVAPDAKGPFTLYISDLVNPQGGDVARVDV